MAEKMIQWAEGKATGEHDAWQGIDAVGVRALFDSDEWQTCLLDLLEYGEYETNPHDGIILHFRATPGSAALREQRAALEQIEALRRQERRTYRAYAVLMQARADRNQVAEARKTWVAAADALAEVEGLTAGGKA